MRQSLFACAAFVLFCGQARAQAVSPPPLEAYGHLPAVQDLRISPSGVLYAYVGVQKDTRKLFVIDGAGKQALVIDIGVAKVRGVEWAGDDHIIVKVTSTVSISMATNLSEVESVAVFTISKHKGFVTFAGHPQVVQAVFGDYGTAQIGGKWYGYYGAYIFSEGRNLQPYRNLMRVDLDTGEFGIVAAGARYVRSWLVTPTGALAAHEEYDNNAQTWTINTGGFPGGQVLASGKDPFGGGNILGQGKTPGSVLVETGYRSNGVIEEVYPSGGTVEPAPGSSKIGGLLFDTKTGLWIGQSEESDERRSTLFDPALQARVNAALSAASIPNAAIISQSDDFNNFIALTNRGRDSGTYWLVDVQTQTAKSIGRVHPDVEPAQVGETKIISWRAKDGLALSGVLTLPPGVPGANLPLVVLPHGGPEARDYPVFDWWAQAFASRGYAVFQPNFRGSSGYGATFRDAGFGEWGRKMQTDISDGVAALAVQGVIDPRRACIVGGSYGGYAALAGVTIQHGLYRCAASYGGVSDLNGMLTYAAGEDNRESPSTRYWKTFMGATAIYDSKLDALAPVKNAAAADAPILLIHGRNDTVVPYAQSELMARQLRQAGKPVEFISLNSEDHWLSREATRTQMLKAMVAFVEKNNPPT